MKMPLTLKQSSRLYALELQMIDSSLTDQEHEELSMLKNIKKLSYCYASNSVKLNVGGVLS